ncbi:DUF4405 domain-containing protein [uncultured Cohaesibacter sp.]|uniref:DUF4405 domain-containing protein n=1 Tax=uncultured Cohaesibacter sp. TaxID=1002546 RepID=UPI00292CD6EE|nr:DUF4405 domain-containing protein [uncultured Cohaesibacter sp.]
MNRERLFRLFFDFIATGLFVFALAFEWFGSLVHEIIGTIFFVLLIVHVACNRRWFASLTKVARNRHRLVVTLINLSLLVAAVALMVTSLMISRDLFAFFGMKGDFLARQIHTLSAYWMLMIVGIHLGMHWMMIMGVARELLNITTRNSMRTWLLRAVTVLASVYGIFAFLEMNMGSKLVLHFTFSYWDFKANWVGFFVNYGSIIWLYAAIGHYGNTKLLAKRRGGHNGRSTGRLAGRGISGTGRNEPKQNAG